MTLIKRTQKPGANLWVFLIIFLLLPAVSGGQANVETFGQNRIQYRRFDWKFFDTQHFRVYHYDRSGQTLARYVCEQAEQDISVIERRMGGQFPKRFNIILYNNYDEARQTNIGLKLESQVENVPGGMMNMIGDQLVVYFDGVHTDLRRQIRAGMTQVVLQRMLFGENFREMVKNSLLLNLPRWTTEGYIAYMVDGWDPKSESEWKNLLDARPHAGFYVLADQYPELAGKAFWKYISDRYGENSIRTLLYTMEMKSSLNQGIKMTLGLKVKKVYDSCIAYYQKAFTRDSLVQETPPAAEALLSIPVPKDNSVVRNIRVSPKGHDAAYVVFKEGEYNVYIQHTAEQQNRTLILSEGRKDFNEQAPDPDYPIMAWANNGYKLAILFRRGRETRLRIWNSLKARIENYVIPPNRFDRVLGMTFNEDDDKIIFSAVKKSQTDLYAFTLKGARMANITNDVWDDVQPWFVSGGSRRGILFLSNRPAPNLDVPAAVNELPTGPMNVFFYDTKTQSTTLLKCSDNKGGNLTQPIQYGSDNFAYLMDSNGIQNKYVVLFPHNVKNMDSAVSVPVTNYSRSILSHQYNPASNQVADVLQMGDQYKIFFRDLLIPGVTVQPKILQPTSLSRSGGTGNLPVPGAFNQSREPDPNDEPVIKSGNVFQSEFSDTTTHIVYPPVVRRGKTADEDTELLLNPLNTDSTYLKLKSQKYRLSFKPDFFSVRLDNTVLFTQYQSTGFSDDPQPSTPRLGALITVSLNDALENHRFTGGIRLPQNFTGMTWFMQYQNFTRRVDWGLVYLRTTDLYPYTVRYMDPSGQVLINDQTGKLTTSLFQGSAAYPLDRIRRLGAHLGLRQDVLDFKAEDTLSLTFSPRQKNFWLMSRMEYVFDNSISPALNIHFGYRYKVYGEYLYGLSGANGGFYNLGVDFRYYKKLYKNCIFAVRIAGAHSAGNKHILYFLGGVDNWLWPKTSSTQSDPGQNYGFQAIATNLRGYEQNARNGNTYAVGNFELRIPVFTTILNRPIQSDFLRNFQLIMFSDIGSAWNGLIPNADYQPYQLAKPPVYLQLEGRNSGLALGYGLGVRSMLLSYFVRLDAAWSYDNRALAASSSWLYKPILYFSIGTDF